MLVWLAVSILVFIFSAEVLNALTPFLTLVFNSLVDNYHGAITVVQGTAQDTLSVRVTILKPIYIEKIPVAPPGYVLSTGTDIVHNLVPIVIFVTGLLSWPTKTLSDRFLLCLIGIPFLLLLIALSIPTLLMGHIEATMLNAAQNLADHDLATPFIMNWVVFIETGGRWLLPLMLLVICVLILNSSRTFLLKALRIQSTQQKVSV